MCKQGKARKLPCYVAWVALKEVIPYIVAVTFNPETNRGVDKTNNKEMRVVHKSS